MRSVHPAWTILTLLLPVGCGGADYAMSMEDGGAYDTASFGAPPADGGGDGGGGDFADTGDDGLGSEDENDFLSLRPASTRTYVFVANATRGTVTRIAVPSLAVLTAEVGVDPHVVLTSGDYTHAAVFNRGSDTVSLVDSESLAVRTVAVRPNLNQMVMSPDGQWVACFYDRSAADEGDANAGGTQSFNEVSLVRVADGAHFPMVVGFNPRQIQFTGEAQTAVVVSDAYLAIVDLTASAPAPQRVQISTDTVDPPAAEEVLLSPDGRYALVRQYGASTLAVVELATGVVSRVDVGANPTDLDVTPDGAQAVAVARGDAELWIYDLADPFLTPEVVSLPDSEVWGSVVLSPDGTKGLLYSTQSGRGVYGVWDRTAADPADAVSVFGLEKPVQRLAVSPDGGVALVFHDRSDTGASSDSPLRGAYGLTLIDLADFFPNPIRLPAEPTTFTQTEDGRTGFFIMDGEPLVVRLDYDTLLPYDISLRSVPVHIGVLPETRILYASQEHDLGRLSFYDTDRDTLQTITGFELNSGITY